MPSFRRSILLSALVTLATGVVVACGDDDSGTTTDTPPTGDAGGKDSGRADGSSGTSGTSGSSGTSGAFDAGQDGNVTKEAGSGDDDDASVDGGTDSGADADADAGSNPSPFVHCTPTAPFPALDEFRSSIPIGTAKVGGTPYLYLQFADGFDSQIVRYSVDTSAGGCSLTADSAFNTTGKVTTDSVTDLNYVDPTGGLWTTKFTGDPNLLLRHEFPGAPFECTFDASVGLYKGVHAVVVNDAGTSGFVALQNGNNDATHFGKLTVSAGACSITSFAIEKTDYTYVNSIALDAEGRLVVPGLYPYFFDPVTGKQTATGDLFGTYSIFSCKSGFCAPIFGGVAACDGTAKNCAPTMAYPAETEGQGGSLRLGAQANAPLFLAQVIDFDKATRHFEVWRAP